MHDPKTTDRAFDSRDESRLLDVLNPVVRRPAGDASETAAD